MKISIIVPVYNAADYLEKTILNILSQDYQDYELICVDDGSTDGSLSVLNKFLKKDSRVKVHSYKENRGQAYARNIGLKLAVGDYVYFMDADDFFVSDNCLSIMNSEICDNQVDILMFNAVLDYKDEELKSRYNNRNKFAFESISSNVIANGSEVMAKLMQEGNFCSAVWTYLYNRLFLENNNILFVEETSPHEDILFTICTFLAAHRVMWMDVDVYKYIIRIGSSVHDEKKMFKRVLGICNVYYELINEINNNIDQLDNEIIAALSHRINGLITFVNENINTVYQAGYDMNSLFKKGNSIYPHLFFFNEYKYINRWITQEEYQTMLNSKNVVIYGSGKAGLEVGRYLRKIGIDKISYVVTNKNAEEDITIESVKQLDDYVIVLGVAKSKYKIEMTDTILQMNLKEPIIIT